MNDVWVKVTKHRKHVVVAACDESLLGKTLQDGRLRFEISASFYKGDKVEIGEAVKCLREATIANIVGKRIVDRAIREGLVHPEGIIEISGVPHAQIVRL